MDNRFSILLKIALALLLFSCLLNMPFAYFQFVSLASVIILLILAWEAKNTNKGIEAGLLVLTALVLQPIYKLPLDRTYWNIIDIIVGFGLMASAMLPIVNFKEPKKTEANDNKEIIRNKKIWAREFLLFLITLISLAIVLGGFFIYAKYTTKKYRETQNLYEQMKEKLKEKESLFQSKHLFPPPESPLMNKMEILGSSSKSKKNQNDNQVDNNDLSLDKSYLGSPFKNNNKDKDKVLNSPFKNNPITYPNPKGGVVYGSPFGNKYTNEEIQSLIDYTNSGNRNTSEATNSDNTTNTQFSQGQELQDKNDNKSVQPKFQIDSLNASIFPKLDTINFDSIALKTKEQLLKVIMTDVATMSPIIEIKGITTLDSAYLNDLYNKCSTSYDLGEYDVFVKKLLTSSYRQNYYQIISSGYNIGNYAEFKDNMIKTTFEYRKSGDALYFEKYFIDEDEFGSIGIIITSIVLGVLYVIRPLVYLVQWSIKTLKEQ